MKLAIAFLVAVALLSGVGGIGVASADPDLGVSPDNYQAP